MVFDTERKTIPSSARSLTRRVYYLFVVSPLRPYWFNIESGAMVLLDPSKRWATTGLPLGTLNPSLWDCGATHPIKHVPRELWLLSRAHIIITEAKTTAPDLGLQ